MDTDSNAGPLHSQPATMKRVMLALQRVAGPETLRLGIAGAQAESFWGNRCVTPCSPTDVALAPRPAGKRCEGNATRLARDRGESAPAALWLCFRGDPRRAVWERRGQGLC